MTEPQPQTDGKPRKYVAIFQVSTATRGFRQSSAFGGYRWVHLWAYSATDAKEQLEVRGLLKKKDRQPEVYPGRYAVPQTTYYLEHFGPGGEPTDPWMQELEERYGAERCP